VFALDNDSLTLQIGKEKAPECFLARRSPLLRSARVDDLGAEERCSELGIGIVVGAVIGFAGGDDPNVDEGGLTASENAVEGAGIFGAMGALIDLLYLPENVGRKYHSTVFA